MEYLTVDEAAARLKAHPETVRRWLRDGRLRGRLISRQHGWRIPDTEIERVLALPQPEAAAAETPTAPHVGTP